MIAKALLGNAGAQRRTRRCRMQNQRGTMPPVLRGHELFATRSYIILAAIVPIVIGGCAFNSSPIHTGLSDVELDQRVQSRFLLGMPGSEVETLLQHLSLGFRIGPIPPRNEEHEPDRGIKAAIYSAGFRYNGPYGEYSSETLYLWFSLDDRLEQVGYERSKRTELPKGATHALRILPLDERREP